MYSLLRVLTTCIGLVLLAACGGGGSSSSSGNGNAAGDATGAWSGSYNAGGGDISIIALIKQDGDAFFYDEAGVLYALPKFTGGNAVSGTLTAFARAGTMFPNGQTSETFDVSASVSSSLITGTFTGNGETGTFKLTRIASVVANPSIDPGNWQGYYIGPGAPAVSLTANNNDTVATGFDSNGCRLSFIFAATGATEGVWSVIVTSNGGPACGGIFTGLAFEGGKDLSGLFGGAGGTYYYLAATNGQIAFVTEVKVQ